MTGVRSAVCLRGGDRRVEVNFFLLFCSPGCSRVDRKSAVYPLVRDVSVSLPLMVQLLRNAPLNLFLESAPATDWGARV